MNIKIILSCSVCQSRNYKGQKNKATFPVRFSKKKYCARCNQRTEHLESK